MFLDPRFWLAISFFIFLALMIKYIMPKIINALDNKSKHIADEIEQARQMKERAEQLLLEAKKHHQESLLYCQKLLTDTKNAAEKLLADSRNDLEQELIRRTNLAKERIKQKEEKTIIDIKIAIILAVIKIIEEKSHNLPNQSSSKIAEIATIDISKMIH